MYELCVFVIIITCATVEGTAGKALLCRDPDTGKFYGVNTTWPSTTFCGNYHCKLRKKNITTTEYDPLRQFNITDHDLHVKIPKKEQLFYSIFKKLAPKSEENNVKDKISDLSSLETLSNEADNDRYLNENEIKSIASVLHTIKKSDLDAIIEIYNLAQDIYKEIDKPSSNNLIPENDSNLKQNVASQLNEFSNNKNKVSYWYEPERGDKRFDIDTADITIVDTKKSKASSQKTTTSTTAKPWIISQNLISDLSPTNKNFTKWMYYYPMSAVQRVPTYIQPPVAYISPYIPLLTSAQKPQRETAKYQKNISPSYYLPYPFSYIHHNRTEPKIYHHLNLDDNPKPKLPIKNAVLINPDLENMPGLSVDTVNKSIKENELSRAPERITNIKYNHDWQTDPISAQILNEVRANADKKLFRPISLRKKITLERVGKVLNVDEIIKRTKRSATGEPNVQTDLYEVYIEKTICQANSTEPGYFRYGNMSRPFPDCCPQRIS